MLCPACREEMLVLEFEGIEVDYSATCGGVWLDAGELQLLGRVLGACDEEVLGECREGPPARRARERRCPVCRRRLDEVPLSMGFAIDRCPSGHGMWFDRDELDRILGAEGRCGAFGAFCGRLFPDRSGRAPEGEPAEG